MHCYSGTPEMSKKFIEMGYYLGVGVPVTRYKDVEETVRITSIDKIVIETDSPVLPPEPFEKHSRNNSLYLNYIVKKRIIIWLIVAFVLCFSCIHLFTSNLLEHKPKKIFKFFCDMYLLVVL